MSYEALLIEELQAHGVTEWTVEHRGKYPQLRFDWKGRRLICPFAISPSDSAHGAANALSCLRKLMGVKRIPEKKSDGHKRKRNRVEAVPDLSITVRPDPWTVLGNLMRTNGRS